MDKQEITGDLVASFYDAFDRAAEHHARLHPGQHNKFKDWLKETWGIRASEHIDWGQGPQPNMLLVWALVDYTSDEQLLMFKLTYG